MKNTNFHHNISPAIDDSLSSFEQCRILPIKTYNESTKHVTQEDIRTIYELFAKQERKTKLLVIDDDDVDRERISRYIDKFILPFETTFAANGQEAIDLLSNNAFDIIILDYQLGDMTGAQLMEKFASLDHYPIPTIMITGMGDEKTVVEAMRLGVHDYIPKKQLNAESLISVLSSALHTAELERRLLETQDQLRRQSLYDGLTGLPNRNLFFDRLNQAILTSERNLGVFTLLMIDLNLFKEVNDSLGHGVGDEVLSIIGGRFETFARKSDTLARLGGDEFACILYNIQTEKDAIACVEKIIATINQPIVVNEHVLQIGASVGIARYPENGTDPTSLLSNADSAMYQAKRSKQKYEIYRQTNIRQSNSTIPLTEQLIQGLRHKELYLDYQPKINLRTHRIIGVEALVRWKNPTMGLLMPDQFINIAERSHLIEEISFQTIEQAFSQWLTWFNKDMRIPIAVNLSARMLDNQEFLPWLKKMSARYKILTCDFTFEITETALASSNRLANRLLKNLQQMGFQLSIDDFGSGFTSFRTLRNSAISELKIDREFVKDIEQNGKDAAIVSSLITLANNLEVRIIAEGVETQAQSIKLQSLGCVLAQGFALARPMSASSFIKWRETFQSGSSL